MKAELNSALKMMRNQRIGVFGLCDAGESLWKGFTMLVLAGVRNTSDS
jgi:hypothetical protein